MIRKAKIDDAKEIKLLVHSLSHFYLEDNITSLPVWFLSSLKLSEFELRLSSQNFSNYVYTESDSIIGYISVKDGSHIYHLFVSEEHQRKGISAALWKHVLEKTESKLFTVRSSVYAVPVYKSFGFKNSGSIAIKDSIQFQSMALKLN